MTKEQTIEYLQHCENNLETLKTELGFYNTNVSSQYPPEPNRTVYLRERASQN